MAGITFRVPLDVSSEPTMTLTNRIRAWVQPEAVKRAQIEEARGDLEAACASWSQAGRPADAVRVMLLRAQAELDPRKRLQFLVQATSMAPADEPAFAIAWT